MSESERVRGKDGVTDEVAVGDGVGVRVWLLPATRAAPVAINTRHRSAWELVAMPKKCGRRVFQKTRLVTGSCSQRIDTLSDCKGAERTWNTLVSEQAAGPS